MDKGYTLPIKAQDLESALRQAKAKLINQDKQVFRVVENSQTVWKKD